MANKKYEFSANDFADEWGEYRKNSKKKMKHRDESNSWRFDKRKDYSMEEDHEEYDERKTGDW